MVGRTKRSAVPAMRPRFSTQSHRRNFVAAFLGPAYFGKLFLACSLADDACDKFANATSCEVV